MSAARTGGRTGRVPRSRWCRLRRRRRPCGHHARKVRQPERRRAGTGRVLGGRTSVGRLEHPGQVGTAVDDVLPRAHSRVSTARAQVGKPWASRTARSVVGSSLSAGSRSSSLATSNTVGLWPTNSGAPHPLVDLAHVLEQQVGVGPVEGVVGVNGEAGAHRLDDEVGGLAGADGGRADGQSGPRQRPRGRARAVHRPAGHRGPWRRGGRGRSADAPGRSRPTARQKRPCRAGAARDGGRDGCRAWPCTMVPQLVATGRRRRTGKGPAGRPVLRPRPPGGPRGPGPASTRRRTRGRPRRADRWRSW